MGSMWLGINKNILRKMQSAARSLSRSCPSLFGVLGEEPSLEPAPELPPPRRGCALLQLLPQRFTLGPHGN